MSQLADPPGSGAQTEVLTAALERALSRHFRTPCRVTQLERRLSDYSSSYPLEELDVGLDDGTCLRLVFKDLSRPALQAPDGKPEIIYEPLREIETYRAILAPHRLDLATCYGAVVDRRLGRYWLFLEYVPGVMLSQVGDFAAWQQAARWLAMAHTRFAGAVQPRQARAARLLAHTRDYYHLWLQRARTFAAAAPADGGVVGGLLDRLAEGYGQLVERLLALPVTLIHGELYPSNVLVQDSDAGRRICPVDWETAGLGPGLIDLAALVAGEWSEEERVAMAFAYRDELPLRDGWPPGPEEFLAALDCCQLHTAVQWIGWSPSWTPPAEHAHDWVGTALQLADKLGL